MGINSVQGHKFILEASFIESSLLLFGLEVEDANEFILDMKVSLLLLILFSIFFPLFPLFPPSTLYSFCCTICMEAADSDDRV